MLVFGGGATCFETTLSIVPHQKTSEHFLTSQRTWLGAVKEEHKKIQPAKTPKQQQKTWHKRIHGQISI